MTLGKNVINGVADTSNKLFTGVNDTGHKLFTDVNDTTNKLYCDRCLFFLQNYLWPPKPATAADIVIGTAMKRRKGTSHTLV
jgi:hypothetical protein